MDLVVFAVLIGVPLLYAVAQVRAVARWTGGFRFAAALPLFGWVVWAALFAADVARDPTAHNLFPFEILIGAVAALLYLALLFLARRLFA